MQLLISQSLGSISTLEVYVRTSCHIYLRVLAGDALYVCWCLLYLCVTLSYHDFGFELGKKNTVWITGVLDVLGPLGASGQPEKWSEQLRCQSALGPLSWPATKNAASQSCWFTAPKKDWSRSPTDHFPVGLICDSASLQLSSNFLLWSGLLHGGRAPQEFDPFGRLLPSTRCHTWGAELVFSMMREIIHWASLGHSASLAPSRPLKEKEGTSQTRWLGSFVAVEELRSWYRALSNGLQRCEDFQRQDLRAWGLTSRLIGSYRLVFCTSLSLLVNWKLHADLNPQAGDPVRKLFLSGHIWNHLETLSLQRLLPCMSWPTSWHVRCSADPEVASIAARLLPFICHFWGS